jgi:hypothetical protein
MDRNSLLLRIESVLGFDKDIVNFNGSSSNSGFDSAIFQVAHQIPVRVATLISTDNRWFRRKAL